MESDTNDIFDGITTRVRFTLMTSKFGGSMRTPNFAAALYRSQFVLVFERNAFAAARAFLNVKPNKLPVIIFLNNHATIVKPCFRVSHPSFSFRFESGQLHEILASMTVASVFGQYNYLNRIYCVFSVFFCKQCEGFF